VNFFHPSYLLFVGVGVVIALVVIGPERLPRVARTLGHLAGRLQRYVSDMKADINREIELDELRKMRDSMQQAASSLESSVRGGLASAENEINRVTESAQEALKDPAEEVKPASAEPSATQPPATQPPATEPPATKPPAAETPAVEKR
jgi:sec-independent protein translocase protein TatB